MLGILLNESTLKAFKRIQMICNFSSVDDFRIDKNGSTAFIVLDRKYKFGNFPLVSERRKNRTS